MRNRGLSGRNGRRRNSSRGGAAFKAKGKRQRIVDCPPSIKDRPKPIQ
jgi:hypothetical protein